jgi:hypothetical protein
MKDFAEAADDDPTYVRPTPFLAVSCDVPWASNDLLSIGCDEYAFVGGAHGSKSFEAIDLELPSLRAVKLRDVVLAAAPTNDKLRALCDAALAKSAGPEAPTLDEGYGPLSFDTFVFSPRGVRFEFKDQMPFVVADALEPEVAYTDLAPILAPGGPASRVRPGVPHASVAAPWSVTDARDAEGG